MSKIASEKATEQLQLICNCFDDEVGGIIKLEAPTTYCVIALNMEQIQKDKQYAFIGIGVPAFGDFIWSSGFHLRLSYENQKISNAEIIYYEETNIHGKCTVDSDDTFYFLEHEKKDSYGLVKRFSEFMDKIFMLDIIPQNYETA